MPDLTCPKCATEGRGRLPLASYNNVNRCNICGYSGPSFEQNVLKAAGLPQLAELPAAIGLIPQLQKRLQSFIEEAAKTTKSSSVRQGRPVDVMTEWRRTISRKHQNERGRAYCVAVQKDNLTTPRSWQKQGCPEQYPDAYKIKRWRDRISKEKNRLTHRSPKGHLKRAVDK